MHQKFAGSTPGQDICLDWGFDPWLGCVWEATNRCFSFPPAKINKRLLGWELKKKASSIFHFAKYYKISFCRDYDNLYSHQQGINAHCPQCPGQCYGPAPCLAFTNPTRETWYLRVYFHSPHYWWGGDLLSHLLTNLDRHTINLKRWQEGWLNASQYVSLLQFPLLFLCWSTWIGFSIMLPINIKSFASKICFCNSRVFKFQTLAIVD